MSYVKHVSWGLTGLLAGMPWVHRASADRLNRITNRTTGVNFSIWPSALEKMKVAGNSPPPPLPTPSPDVGAINVSQPGDGASRAFQIRLDHDWKWSLGFVEWWLKSNRWSLWSKLRQVPTPAKLTTPDISTGEHPLWNGNKKKINKKQIVVSLPVSVFWR